MDISTQQYKRCDVVTVSGRIDSATAPQLEEALDAIMDAGRFKLVLDMTDVNFVSSKGLWVLIGAQKKCKRYRRGEVVLVNIKEEIRSAFDLVGMSDYFTMSDNITDAVGSF
ncbi:MAG: STAS domain-containing protein [Anaerolineales bacterium]|jgi:anti-sigma B factor antagonist|nr:STAS domain-containing protein [Anaerolineales bacterium]MCK4978616.1 STAS domain-containing protein [Anaerolineales bacterium]MCK5314627.1 STAS domain-containing protein [Anaerolineales bacterium]